jgi:hypothetical protein
VSRSIYPETILSSGERNKLEEASKETPELEPGDRLLIISFAMQRRLNEDDSVVERSPDILLNELAMDEIDGGFIEAVNLGEFLSATCQTFSVLEQKDVLRRALGFMIPTSGETIESSFLSLFSALESTLTFLRRQDEYHILPRQDFEQLERDLKKWLKQHPLFADDAERRALVYEKIRELNRLPFSTVFKKFCERYDLYLADLWPLLGPRKDWPLLEIRHRLVHGDPFLSRPVETLQCAREHLKWTAARMILSVLEWPISKSKASPEQLSNNNQTYTSWPEQRERLA